MFLVECRGQSHRECGMRTGELGVNMRFMRTEEGGVVAVSRTPGPSLVDIIVARASLSDASPSKSRGKGAEGSGKGRYSDT
jgi:hypothetical protein